MPSCHRLGCAAEPASVPVPLFCLFITGVPNGVVTNGAQWGKLFQGKPRRRGTTMEIGEKIRKLRTDAGMTQDDLASRLAVTRTAVSKWETGKGWPGVDSLKLIADEFGVTIDALVSDEDVEQKRAVEDRRGLRYYWAAIACALAAMALALVSYQGLLPKGLAFAGTWGTCGGIIGYVIFGFLFSRSSERVGIKRTIVGRIVVILVVLVAMVGYVAAMGATP